MGLKFAGLFKNKDEERKWLPLLCELSFGRESN
jgi:hypothetical protein